MKKNVLITGANGNLGKASVAKFLAEGYRVHATVTPGKQEVETSADIIYYPADLLREAAANEVVAKITAEYQSIDAALLLVGGYASGTLESTDATIIQKMFSLNFYSAYHVVRPVFQQMASQPAGGRIVLIGSRPAIVAADGKRNIAYALAKSLIFKLAELLNAEGKDKNVITSVIVPSTIDTPENRKAMPDADIAKWVTPEAIAETIFFVVSEKGAAFRDPILKLYNKS